MSLNPASLEVQRQTTEPEGRQPAISAQRQQEFTAPQGTVWVLGVFATLLVGLWVYAYIVLVTRG